MAMAIAHVNFPTELAVTAVVFWHLIVGALVTLPYVRSRKGRTATS
jgi:BASS family bile acid:Na+ symporter